MHRIASLLLALLLAAASSARAQPACVDPAIEARVTACPPAAPIAAPAVTAERPPARPPVPRGPAPSVLDGLAAARRVALAGVPAVEADVRAVARETSAERAALARSFLAEWALARGDAPAARAELDAALAAAPAGWRLRGPLLHRRAWLRVGSDAAGAARDLAAAVRLARAGGADREALRLRDASRRALAVAHLSASAATTPGRPGAVDLDRLIHLAGSTEDALEALETLADAAGAAGREEAAEDALARLGELAPGSPSACRWAVERVALRLQRQQSSLGLRALEELLRDVAAFRRRVGLPAAHRADCGARAAGLLLSIATRLHRDAIGTDTHVATRDREQLRVAALLYEAALAGFPELESLRVAGGLTPHHVAYHRAELAWSGEDWVGCGEGFDRALRLDPEGPFAAEARYASVLCWGNATRTPRWGPLEQVHPPSPHELRHERALRRAVCADPRGDEAGSMVALRARLLRSIGRPQAALAVLRAGMREHPELAEDHDELRDSLARDRPECAPPPGPATP